MYGKIWGLKLKSLHGKMLLSFDFLLKIGICFYKLLLYCPIWASVKINDRKMNTSDLDDYRILDTSIIFSIHNCWCCYESNYTKYSWREREWERESCIMESKSWQAARRSLLSEHTVIIYSGIRAARVISRCNPPVAASWVDVITIHTVTLYPIKLIMRFSLVLFSSN